MLELALLIALIVIAVMATYIVRFGPIMLKLLKSDVDLGNAYLGHDEELSNIDERLRALEAARRMTKRSTRPRAKAKTAA